MLFTTALFTLAYLPLVLLVFFGLGRYSHQGAAAWLFLASLFFYAFWMPVFTWLLLGSIVFNFTAGSFIARRLRCADQAGAYAWAVAGVAGNLLLLAYFKYANFLVGNVNHLFGTHWAVGHIVLPLGISFFTFTQIAFLVDVYKKGVQEPNWVHYGLFVTYFPHLVAGPVLHHAQMMPQFRLDDTYRMKLAHVAAGLTIFMLGLVKKVVFADGISPYADAVFDAADGGLRPDFQEAWIGAFAYTLQLYFDFSGYSDMALGLSLMFNVRLPFNFNSPYRARNISDFWRRWHISLSTFLRDYLYIALGGNRRGEARRYANLLATMVLGGLWHGASWSFVIWGALHGGYLVVQQLWRRCIGPVRPRGVWFDAGSGVLSWGLTMLSVVCAWVVFRAATTGGVAQMFSAMVGWGHAGEVHEILWNQGLQLTRGLAWCLVLGCVAVLPWNSNLIGKRLQVVAHASPARAGFMLGVAVVGVLMLVIVNGTRGVSGAFIYFNF